MWLYGLVRDRGKYIADGGGEGKGGRGAWVFSPCSINRFDGLIQAFLKRYRQRMFQHLHSLCVTLCAPHKLVQLTSQLRAQSFIPVHRPPVPIACRSRGIHSYHRIGVRLIPINAPATNPTSARTPTLPCRPPHAAASDAIRLFHHRSPYPQVLTPLATPYPKYVHISSNAIIDARTLSRLPLVRHARTSSDALSPTSPFFDPLAYRGYARAHHAGGCRQSHPLRAHLHRLLFRAHRLTDALRPLDAFCALVAFALPLAARMTVFSCPVRAAFEHSAIVSVHTWFRHSVTCLSLVRSGLEAACHISAAR